MITFQEIEQARQRLAPYLLYSPFPASPKLSRLIGCQLALKLENLQMTGSYKERGALNKILSLSLAERAQGVITSSAGNHGQAVAYAAKLQGLKAVVVMPETTPLSKLRGTQEFEPEIVLYGQSYQEAYEEAQRLQSRHGYTFIHAFDDPLTIAGQGTIALELHEQIPDLELLVVPVGGGGLIAGIAFALKTLNPQIQIVGVQAQVMPGMRENLKAGEIVSVPFVPTLADGIAVSRVGQFPFSLVRQYVDSLVTVTEEEIANAIMLLLEKEKILTEGAGAVGVAALVHQKLGNIKAKKVGVILSGGNLDMTMLAHILEQGLAQDGRLWHLNVILPDQPGTLAALAQILGEQRANILQIEHQRAFFPAKLGEAFVECTLETKGPAHIQSLRLTLEARGFRIKER